MATRRGKRTPRLAQKLAEYRHGRAWGEVATALERWVPGTHRGTIRNYEVAERAPDFVILWGLCKVYGVPFGPVAEALVLELLGHEADAPAASEITPDVRELLDLYRSLAEIEGAQEVVKNLCRDLQRIRTHADASLG